MRRSAIAVLLFSAAIQIGLSAIPDTMGDLLQYRSWTRTLTLEGLSAAYWPTLPSADSPHLNLPIDYPPILPYALWVLGHALHAFSPAALGNDWLLDFLIRLPLVGSNLILALLIYVEVRGFAPAAANLALALVALNPALIFDTAYWGQADAPCALLVTASLVALVRGRPEWAVAAFAAAALVKPIAYPLAPLVAFETVRRFGMARALRSGMWGLLVGCVSLMPFSPSGRVLDALRSFVTQVDAMPYVTVNAHNLWWLVGLGAPWTPAHARPLGLLPWSALSLLLFAAFYVAVLVPLSRSREPRSLYGAAATVSFGFFVLSTHMHENHLFLALPLLALFGVESKPTRMVLGVLSAAMLANMVLHDPFLTSWARPYTPGPHILFPSTPDPQVELRERLGRLGYPWIVSQMRGENTVVGVAATFANALAIVFSFGGWLVFLLRAGAFDPILRAPRWSIPPAGRPSGPP